MNFTFESDAEPLISPSPAVTLGFHGMRNVTAKSSCCQPSALFMSLETSGSAHFGASCRNVVAVHFKDCFAAQVRRVIAGANLLLLARQERKVIVRPEN